MDNQNVLQLPQKKKNKNNDRIGSKWQKNECQINGGEFGTVQWNLLDVSET